ncbi:phosphoadenosine phosphosulfate reductase [Citrobacter meridianamericanus]|uniref:phosphoadenosine phosphosulfate reductase n=1 Tax=Citrobacter meridianamericanus TaxID=2894201 RepID=UPI00351D343F
MTTNQVSLGVDVFQAGTARIDWIFSTFSRVCVSFSGGKDSTVLLHMVATAARRYRRKLSVLFIDWEVQFQHTIDHVMSMKTLYEDVTDEFIWVALPLTTVNGVSQYQPEWMAWAPGVQWVRQPPDFAVTDEDFFPFYRHGMTFESFVNDFGSWYSRRESSVVLTGVRADESLNRYWSVANPHKMRYSDDKPWTTASQDGTYYIATPIYDWKTRDIWIFHYKSCAQYNPLYDLMFRAGVPFGNMRICEPFGPEQKRGLWLYHVLEPDTWAKACSRVSGACSGAMYGSLNGSFYSVNKSTDKPAGFTWKSYALYLLDSMPPATAEHYRNKISVYLRWCLTHGYPEGIPEEQAGDTGSKDIPSWKRVCRTLIRNDYWCRTLSFSPNKAHSYARYRERIQKQRKEWGVL